MKTFALTLALALVTGSAGAEPIDQSEIRVVDGDTINIHNRPPNVRLVGFNAPESWKPACSAEQQLGDRAKNRLRELVRAGGALDLTLIACSCPAGTEGMPNCNRGRHCGILRAGGRDVGETLIAEGLAVPFVCGATRCPPVPRPWCPQP